MNSLEVWGFVKTVIWQLNRIYRGVSTKCSEHYRFTNRVTQAEQV